VTTVALAGRRVDACDTTNSRFPRSATGSVEQRLYEYFNQNAIRHLIVSAACGADLLALKAADEAGISARTIILPFSVEEFRHTSVIDRPGSWDDRHGVTGDWSKLYDRMIDAADAAGTLVLLGCVPGDKGAYAAATERIVAEAARGGDEARACVVWEGTARGPVDHSNQLAQLASGRGWLVDQIQTCSGL
jgi:hypothetical protein